MQRFPSNGPVCCFFINILYRLLYIFEIDKTVCDSDQLYFFNKMDQYSMARIFEIDHMQATASHSLPLIRFISKRVFSQRHPTMEQTTKPVEENEGFT